MRAETLFERMDSQPEGTFLVTNTPNGIYRKTDLGLWVCTSKWSDPQHTGWSSQAFYYTTMGVEWAFM